MDKSEKDFTNALFFILMAQLTKLRQTSYEPGVIYGLHCQWPSIIAREINKKLIYIINPAVCRVSLSLSVILVHILPT